MDKLTKEYIDQYPDEIQEYFLIHLRHGNRKQIKEKRHVTVSIYYFKGKT